ncbi:MAG: hypothetical protein EA412_12770 [Chitinophagaceae bacterium]|nr:MAG: hypothetical protein EA412_12770 [Chitinophagaceae bacterium]
MSRVDLKNKKLEEACKDYNVKELYVFGSFVGADFNKDSDLDFLVEFKQHADIGAFDQFMGLKEKLEQIFKRPVDLLTVRKFRNPIFDKEIHQSKSLIYAA